MPEMNKISERHIQRINNDPGAAATLFWAVALVVSAGLFNPATAQVQLLGPGVNSGYDESVPVISADGQALFFTRKGHPQNLGEKSLEDVWMSRLLPNNQWARAVNLGPTVNDRYVNVPVSVGPNKNSLYFTSGPDYDLVRASSTGRGWSFPETLTNDAFFRQGKIHSYSLSQDGKTLFFSWSGEEGNPDLYITFRLDNDAWTTPLPLPVNSPGTEINPFFARDGRTLYFASNGLGGRGRLDLFLTRRLDDSWQQWSEPENLGPDVNSAEDNAYISLTARGDEAYVVVKSETGDLNIGVLLLPQELQPSPVAVYEGRLVSAETGIAPNGVTLEMVKLKNPGAPPVRLRLSQDGAFRLTLPRNEPRGLFASAPGYLPAGIDLENTETESLPENLGSSATFSAAYRDRDKRISLLQDRLTQIEDAEIGYRRQANASLKVVKEKNIEPEDNLSAPVMDSLLRTFQLLFAGNRAKTDRDTLVARDSLGRLPEDQELQDLRRQYEAYYHPDTPPPAAEPSQQVPDGVRRFETILEETRRELLQVLRPLIVQTMEEEYWPQVKSETEKNVDPAAQIRLRENEAQIKEEVRQDYVILNPGAYDFPEHAGDEPWEKELRQKLRGSLRRQIDELVRKSLGDDIRSTMQLRTLQILKDLEGNGIQKEMDRLVLEQIKEEERQVDPWGGDRETGLTIKSGLPAITKGYEEIQTRLLLIPIEAGRSTVLSNIFFNPNNAQLKEASYPELERVVRFLTDNPGLIVEIGSHTDGYPSHAAAIQLSAQRAKRIYDYLLAQGIGKNRLRYRGYGKTRPIASNDSQEGRRMNQRIELKILSTE